MSVIISLDFGVKKMGAAVGNTLTQTAQPLTILPMDNGAPDWAVLLELITKWQAQQILVGLPLNMDGSASHLSKRASKFAKRLNHKLKESHIACAVSLVDERLSSQEAKHADALTRHNDKHNPIDDKAALVLLMSYFAEPVAQTLP